MFTPLALFCSSSSELHPQLKLHVFSFYATKIREQNSTFKTDCFLKAGCTGIRCGNRATLKTRSITSCKTSCLRPACLDVCQFSTVPHSHGAQRCHGQVGTRKAPLFSFLFFFLLMKLCFPQTQNPSNALKTATTTSHVLVLTKVAGGFCCRRHLRRTVQPLLLFLPSPVRLKQPGEHVFRVWTLLRA